MCTEIKQQTITIINLETTFLCAFNKKIPSNFQSMKVFKLKFTSKNIYLQKTKENYK